MNTNLPPIIESESESESAIQEPKQETAPPKRRGRPPGVKNAPKPPMEEKQIEAGSATQQPKRGRPRKNSEEFSESSKIGLSKQVQGIHMMAAQLSGFQELAISEAESLMLADAIINTSHEYGLSLSGKTGALLQLVGTAAIIYIPRFSIINQKIKVEKRNKRNSETIIDDPISANG